MRKYAGPSHFCVAIIMTPPCSCASGGESCPENTEWENPSSSVMNHAPLFLRQLRTMG